MELSHTFTIPAGIEDTWTALSDIEGVAGCFPGAQVTSVEGDSFEGTVKVKLGPIALVYAGSGRFTDQDESARRMEIDAKGKDKRGNGTAGAHVTVSMSSQGSGTAVEVHTDLSITGKPAQFGRGVIQDVSDKLLGQFTDCLSQRLDDSTPEQAAGAASAGAGGGDLAAALPGGSDSASTGSPEAGTSTTSHAAAAPLGPAPTGPVSGGPGSSRNGRSDDAVDLGATVLPVLAKNYGKQAAAVLGVVAFLVVLRRLLGGTGSTRLEIT